MKSPKVYIRDFYRKHAGAEIDLVVDRGQERIGFEFKPGLSATRKDFSGLRAAIAEGTGGQRAPGGHGTSRPSRGVSPTVPDACPLTLRGTRGYLVASTTGRILTMAERGRAEGDP